MSVIDSIFEGCKYGKRSEQVCSGASPERKLAILTCMDIRVDPYNLLGLEAGDAHIIRNAGAIVTDDVIRSLILSHQAMDTRELMILAHTDCGLLRLDESELIARLRRRTGLSPSAPVTFHSFSDLAGSVHRQLLAVRDHPWLQDMTARGFVYDVETGRVAEISHVSPGVKT